MKHGDSPARIDLEGFVIDLERWELRTRAGVPVPLRPQAFAALQLLASKADRVVAKEELVRYLWPDTAVTDDSLVQCIRTLRRALGDTARRVIRTEPKRGYRLVTAPAPAVSTPVPRAVQHSWQSIRFVAAADGVRLAWASSGKGPPLMRAAHWMTHLEYDWYGAINGPWVQRFAERYRLLRYDMRGCGLSDRHVAPGSLDDQVRDLEAVADAAGLERFALLGSSGGGAISIRYAARHPDRVDRLVLVGGLARGALKREHAAATRANVNACMQLIRDGWGQDNPTFRQLLTSQLFPGANLEQMQSFNQLQRLACSPEQAACVIRMMAEFDASPDLARVRCPTLVLHSPHDAWVPFEEGLAIAASVESARFEPFESVNHLPLPDEPAFLHVGERIDAFLAEDLVGHASAVADRPGPPAGYWPQSLRLVGSAPRPGGAAARSRST